jgi:hypothetical protein
MSTDSNYDELIDMSEEKLTNLKCEDLTYHAMKTEKRKNRN